MKWAFICWLAACAPVFAGLKFGQSSKTVDTTADAASITISFAFENDGEEPALIEDYDAGCNCMSVSVEGNKLLYRPGEKGTLHAVFDLKGFSGTVDKQILLWVKGDPQPKPSVKLDIRVNIPVLVEISPKTLVWELGEAAVPKTVTVTVPGADPVRILSVSTPVGSFQRELKTIEEGRRYELVVTPADTSKTSFGSFRIETDSPVERYRFLHTTVFVRKPGAPDPVAAPAAAPHMRRETRPGQFRRP